MKSPKQLTIIGWTSIIEWSTNKSQAVGLSFSIHNDQPSSLFTIDHPTNQSPGTVLPTHSHPKTGEPSMKHHYPTMIKPIMDHHLPLFIMVNHYKSLSKQPTKLNWPIINYIFLPFACCSRAGPASFNHQPAIINHPTTLTNQPTQPDHSSDLKASPCSVPAVRGTSCPTHCEGSRDGRRLQLEMGAGGAGARHLVAGYPSGTDSETGGEITWGDIWDMSGSCCTYIILYLYTEYQLKRWVYILKNIHKFIGINIIYI